MTDEMIAGEQPAGATAPEKTETLKSKAVPSPFVEEQTLEAKKESPKAEAAHESDEDDETGESATPDGADTTEGPRKNKGVGKRINELTREKYEAIRRAEELERRLSELESAVKKSEPTQQPKKDAEPKFEDFDFDIEAYQKAHSEWTSRRAVEQLKKEMQQEREQEGRQARVRSFQEREIAFAADHPDYEEVAKASHVPITPAMAEIIVESDQAPAVAYYLGQNLEEAASIAQMSPIAAARAIGRIEASLSARKPASPPKKTTSAPPPPVTVHGAGKAAKSIDDPNISTAERIALWKAERQRPS